MDHVNYGRNDRLGGFGGKRGSDLNGAEMNEKDRAQEYGFEEQGKSYWIELILKYSSLKMHI